MIAKRTSSKSYDIEHCVMGSGNQVLGFFVGQSAFPRNAQDPDFIQLLSTYWTFLKLSLRHVIIAGGGRQCEGQGCEK